MLKYLANSEFFNYGTEWILVILNLLIILKTIIISKNALAINFVYYNLDKIIVCLFQVLSKNRCCKVNIDVRSSAIANTSIRFLFELERSLLHPHGYYLTIC